jgi:ribulose bisphosphate carboxylase small subunit
MKSLPLFRFPLNTITTAGCTIGFCVAVRAVIFAHRYNLHGGWQAGYERSECRKTKQLSWLSLGVLPLSWALPRT